MNPAYYPLINPRKLGNRQQNLTVEFFCTQCHDIENDVHWGDAAKGRNFENNWKRIAHPSKK